ncbi:hypothetical protein LZ578_00505 [Jeotgalibaca sp. MA1X17-3]|uniref:CdaR family protein n=1 Tax=Jeotgalibaca sp. MA1X17-3 TaxID=2908211 RepID=UPI001F32E62A|nr:CdaR family protein [Jeotgalibaca sp. MA1X17-3]UJF15727.1 hypothetical protein LZ578_00505 [Jeotgalibaca sp. MA1X17-3]
MKKKEENLFENTWMIRIIALLIALLLFGYVYSENYGLTTTNRNDAISTNRNETISNLPIQINMDTSQYFLSGLPETVVLTLSGPESVLVQTLSAGDYNIVTEDLNLLGPGRHTIQLRAENISENLSYQLTPSRVNVEIEEKVTIESPVQVIFDSSTVDEEFIAGEPKLSKSTVIITGPSSTIERIDRIYVKVAPNSLLNSDINVNSVIQVEDSNKNKLNVTIEPQEINIQIPIEPYKKTVPLIAKQKGTPETGKTYEFDILDEGDVTINGNRNLLADIDEVEVEVDVTGIKTDTIVTLPIQLPFTANSLSPKEVQVNVKVKTTVN